MQCSSDVLRSPDSFTAMQRFVYSVTHILLIVTNICGLSIDHNDGDYHLSCNRAVLPQPLLWGLSSVSSFIYLFFNDTLNTLLRYAKILSNSSLEMSLLVQTYCFMHVRRCGLWHVLWHMSRNKVPGVGFTEWFIGQQLKHSSENVQVQGVDWKWLK